MTLATVMAELIATRRGPTDEEIALIVREGSLVDVGIALSNTCALSLPLRERYRELFNAR